ncbi:MAG: glycosyltransferase family 9 protein [Ignavibacteria bacterium]|jgi:ADP-heptose:LPS heptosyltransferase|nr:glycosyltransferase family 9 protein [Ignavibacteria bacterium]
MKRRALFRIFDKYLGIPIVIIMAILLKRKRRLPIENVKKILIIKLAAIGDSILLIPMLRTLKKSFPRSEITFICTKINYAVAKKTPYIDKVVEIDVHSYLRSPLKFFKFIKDLRRDKYEVIIDAGQWERINAIMTMLARSDFSVGFKTERQMKHYGYDSIITHTRTKHELETFLDLLVPLGINITEEDKKLEYFLNDEDFNFAHSFWFKHELEDKTVICLHPGCGENGRPREWAVENYISLGKRLVDYDENIRILITGAQLEEDRCKEIAAGIGRNTINTAGQFPLDNVVALVKKVKLIVCSNTGMLHIASCVGTKTMGLHGPTNPAKWGSYNKNAVLIQSDKFCSPCLYLGHDYGCQAPQCMAHISVDDVFIYIRKALDPELFPVMG